MITKMRVIYFLLATQLLLHCVYTYKIIKLEDAKFECERERSRDLTAIMHGYNELAEHEKAYQKVEKKMERRKTILVGR